MTQKEYYAYERLRGCLPKKAFVTEALLKKQLDMYPVQAGMNGYKCAHCQMWHVGHDRTLKGMKRGA